MIDGLQLEKGSKATAYSGNPFGLALETDSPDGLVFEADKPFKSKLLLRGPAGAKGSMEVTASDFFKNERLGQSFRFELPADGEQSFELPLDKTLDKGVIRFESQAQT